MEPMSARKANLLDEMGEIQYEMECYDMCDEWQPGDLEKYNLLKSKWHKLQKEYRALEEEKGE